MKVESLRVHIAEDDVNQLLPRAVPPDAGVENLQVRLTPEGMLLLGEYRALLVRMSFETRWEIALADNRVALRLAGVKVAGLPAGLLRGVLLKMVRDATAKEPGITVEEDKVVVDVAAAIKEKQLPLEIHLRTVKCGAGELLIEAGAPATI